MQWTTIMNLPRSKASHNQKQEGSHYLQYQELKQVYM